MKAIILAAGKGSRLDAASGEAVKCLVKLGGESLIERQIRCLRDVDIYDVTMVVGFQAERIRQACGPDIKYVENTIFAETNSLYSLWLAREFFTEGFVVMNSDVLFHPQLLSDLITAKYEDAFLVSFREDTLYGEEEMKVKIRGGRLTDISKTMNPAEADGENLGILKFGVEGAVHLRKQMEILVAEGAVRSWAPQAFLEFAKIRPLHAVGTRGYPWIEIDFPEDYLRAQEEILPLLPGVSASAAIT